MSEQLESAELAIIREAIAGDRAAQERLWRRQRPWLAAVLIAHAPRGHAGSEVEDLLQEVAVRFVSNLVDLRHPQKLRSWLRTIAINVARGAHRKLQRRKTYPLPSLDHSAYGSHSDATRSSLGSSPHGASHFSLHYSQQNSESRSADDTLETRQELERVLEIIAQLPDDYQEILLLRSVRGLTQRQLAATLEVPETTIETRLARARRMLRERLLKRAER